MPKQPRVTARHMLRALRRDGWQVESSVGSHLQLVHPSKPGKVTIPMHTGDIIGPKLFRNILAQAGLATDDLRRLLYEAHHMLRYTVVLEPEEDEVGGYAVSVPALPGCFSQGRTIDEALAHIREAIALHLGALRRDGEPFPADVTPIVAAVDVELAEPRPVDAALLAELDADEIPAGPAVG